MKPTSRRTLIAAGIATASVSALELLSLRGKLDHRRELGASARDRYHASVAAFSLEAPAVVHVGHSTHLLQIAGVKLLTDPWFHDPAFGALSHEIAPAVVPADVGALDAILITHDHADHADLRAIDKMDKRACAIVATRELAAKVKRLGFSDVTVLAPWEEKRVGAAIVSAVPGQHDIYEVGFVVRGAGKSVYFAGDTRLHHDLPAIAERYAPDLSLLPVDGTRLTGGAMHVMTPEDAATAAKVLKSKVVMPSHAEAYFSDPFAGSVLASTVPGARAAFAERVRRDLPGVRCVVPEPGELVLC